MLNEKYKSQKKPTHIYKKSNISIKNHEEVKWLWSEEKMKMKSFTPFIFINFLSLIYIIFLRLLFSMFTWGMNGDTEAHIQYKKKRKYIFWYWNKERKSVKGNNFSFSFFEKTKKSRGTLRFSIEWSRVTY